STKSLRPRRNGNLTSIMWPGGQDSGSCAEGMGVSVEW
ncbi:glutamate receptor 2.7, partial [Phtheirospermum japonicum]